MNSFSLHQFLHFLFALQATATIATISISPGQSLSGNQTLISAKGEFRLGFFSPQNTTTNNSYYLAIWYNKIQNQVMWIANRDAPVSDPNTSQFALSQEGNLVLLDHSQTQIWSSNISQAAANRSLVATLLDTGNLVLTDSLNSSYVVWQSFDYPTDTLMLGEWFGQNPATGVAQSLTSWKNTQDPGTGIYSCELYPPGAGSSGQYVLIWNQSKVYYYFETIKTFVSSIADMPSNVNYSIELNGQQFRMTVNEDEPKYFRAVLGVNGQIEGQAWFSSSKRWIVQRTIPTLCDVYSACGAFGVCDLRGTSQYCTCLPGFEPDSSFYWDVVKSWNGGSCIRRLRLKCDYKNSNTEEDGFIVVSNMRLPDDGYDLLLVQSQKNCESACLNNCTCNAYSYEGKKCLIFNGEIRNLKYVPSDDTYASVLYLRLSASDIPIKKSRMQVYRIAVPAAIGAVVLTLVCVCLGVSLNGRKYQSMVATNGYLNQFHYAFLVDCTKRFSQKLGQGSFGSVFKGQLPDSTPIAVKRLEGLRQGEKQFRAEVRTLGNAQHVNLVRLLGFSLKGEERLLVYLFMTNGSLDSHLFKSGAKILDWKTRYQIIQGVARGLAYLHEQCREQIIHCDIKPENILLDSDFSPKIADFGMAKLLGREFSDVLTTTRGTFGYLAPEWISGLPITPKADVYSYGMMLFEIVSGRRNHKPTKNGYFPGWAVKNVSSGQVESLLDERLEAQVELEELTRVLTIASWCIQDAEFHRPTMAEVLRILDGSVAVGVAPVPRSLQGVAFDDDQSTSESSFTEE